MSRIRAIVLAVITLWVHIASAAEMPRIELDAERARTEPPSSAIRLAWSPAACKVSSTRCKVAESTLTVALADETWTAGASP